MRNKCALLTTLFLAPRRGPGSDGERGKLCFLSRTVDPVIIVGEGEMDWLINPDGEVAGRRGGRRKGCVKDVCSQPRG